MVKRFNASARQFRNDVHHVVLYHRFNWPVRTAESEIEDALSDVGRDFEEEGISLHMEEPLYQGVAAVFTLKNNGIEMQIFRKEFREGDAPLLESDMTFNMLPAKALAGFETTGETQFKNQLVDTVFRMFKAEGFVFASDALGKHAVERLFDLWYKEEIQGRPSKDRTYHIPSPENL